MEPELHVENELEVGRSVEIAKSCGNYTEIALSDSAIAHLLEGDSISLLFLNDGYEETGMIHVHRVKDGETYFKVKVPGREETISTI